jgi:uncharacterized protein YecE (DUF72 family)
MQCRIGTSGWNYKHWRGRFYPADLPQSRWFEYYAAIFDTVEINNTFYQQCTPETFDRWRKQAADDFIYCVKCNRYLTHNLKLTNAEDPLKRFFTRVRRLRANLGPLLYQLPPRWKKNVARLQEFCRLLPKKFTHVIEFREAEWLSDDVFEVLAEHKVCLCIHDLLPDHPRLVTGPTAYVRFHGTTGKYQGRYGRTQLRPWARWIQKTADEGHDVYAFFNNDAEAFAIADAKLLRKLVDK